jgi:hypothetical protein
MATVEIDEVPLEPYNLTYEPDKLKQEIEDNLHEAFQSDRHGLKMDEEE